MTNLTGTRLTLLAGLLIAGTNIHAHDGLKTTTITEGTGGDNAITIGHGCEDREKPIVAQSVVFPTVAPELIASDGHTIANLSEIVDQMVNAGQVDTIQDKNIFVIQRERQDSIKNTIGFYSKNGKLQTYSQGRVPFYFTAPTFPKASCATELTIEIAVADVCVLSSPTIKAFKTNLWIPDNGSKYATLGSKEAVDGIGEPLALHVKRDLTNNPLSSSCGAGFTAIVRPSAADIDANLGFPGWHY